MKAVNILILVGVAVIGIGVVRWMITRPAAINEAGQASNEPGATLDAAKYSAPPANESLSPELVRRTSNNMPTLEAKLAGEINVASAPAQSQKPKEPLHNPEARAAMSLVGIDPDAEAYWLGAIFDSSLPENEREDLMEDLNEEGLSDAKHPRPQDLPVILNRLVIIEEVLPFADEFMVTHLGEAYKDLINLAEITQGRGEPVR